MKPRARPGGNGLHGGDGRRGKGGQGVKLDRGGPGGEEEDPQRAGHQDEARAAVLRTEETKKQGQHQQKGKDGGTCLQPEPGGIRVARNKLPEQVQGG